MRIIFVFVICIFLYACGREELPVQGIKSGSAQLGFVNLGSHYEYQSGFDFASGIVSQSYLRENWELKFGSGIYSEIIQYNSSLFMRFVNTGKTRMDSAYTVSDAEFQFVHPTGRNDSVLFQRDFHSGHVILLDMGIYQNGDSRGYVKLQLLEKNPAFVRLAIAPPASANFEEVKIDLTSPYVYYSILRKSVVDIQINPQVSDLFFTQYTYMFYEPFTPYLVSGVLLAGPGMRVAKDSLREFSDVTLSDTSAYVYSSDLDAIGYDWKVYDFSKGIYAVNSDLVYIVQTRNGYYYKLRFLDFYTDTGEKGYISFEYMRL